MALHSTFGTTLGLAAGPPIRVGEEHYSVFNQLNRLIPDAVLGLMGLYRADTSPQKVDLGVGVYQDATGMTPVLGCVRRAEQRVITAQTTKSYVGATGREEFNRCVEELVLGLGHPLFSSRRVRTIQTPGGCGALRVGADLVRIATPRTTVYVSDPSWGNHVPLLSASGLNLERYPYYDQATHAVCLELLLERLDQASAGDVVVLHACCHNPTGVDPTFVQWRRILELILQRRLVPFFDLAYQGLGDGLSDDVVGLRWVVERVPEALIAVSFSKNLGLYRERIGALMVLSEGGMPADAVQSHVMQIARSIYSMPPDHGAAIAATILTDAELRTAWIGELEEMRERIQAMRALLASELRQSTGSGAFDFIAGQKGMFSLLGLTREAVTRLREKHHIYMTNESRINLAGISPANVNWVARAIALETRTLP